MFSQLERCHVQSLHFDLSPCRMNCVERRVSVSPPPMKNAFQRPRLRWCSPALVSVRVRYCAAANSGSHSSSRERGGDANLCKTSAKSKRARDPFAPSAFVMTYQRQEIYSYSFLPDGTIRMDTGDYPFSWPSTRSGIPTSFSRLSARRQPSLSRSSSPRCRSGKESDRLPRGSPGFADR